MKSILLLPLFLISAVVFGQNRNTSIKNSHPIQKKETSQKKEVDQIVVVEPVFDENHIYPSDHYLIDSQPEYIEGTEKFYEDFNKTFKPLLTEDIRGRIFIEFVIEKNGSLTQFRVLRDLGQQTGTEAIKVIQSLKNWKPGTRNKKNVRIRYTVPFKVEIKANATN